jgi:Dolichyl-phosphate-mannose-protein mannosyltransferase
MLPVARTPWFFHALAALLIVAFFVQSFSASLIKSPTSDEPPHLTAGLAYVEKGNFRPNPQHPPLLKELSAVSLLLAGIRLPQIPGTDRMLVEEEGHQIEWGVGNYLIQKNGPQIVMFWARLPLIILATLGALGLYLWGRQLFGDAAALGALFLYTVDPTIVAHSAFVTTDVGVTAFTIFFFFSLWNYLRRPSLPRLLITGILMGLFLCAKFSAVVMLLMALVLTLASALWPSPPQGSDPKPGSRFRRMASRGAAFLGMCVVAALVIMVVYRSFNGVAMYAYGMTRVDADFNPSYLAYMAGQLQHRFYSYFAVAWLLKEPIATIILVAIGTVVLVRNRTVPLLDKLFLFLPPAALFLAVTLKAGNIGVRYVIPTFPFAYLAGGLGLAFLSGRKAVWPRLTATALCIWSVVAAVGIYPDHLAYMNEMACLLREPGKVGWDGGSKCGTLWLDDSNTDWGQGLEQLKAWMKSHPDSRTIRLLYSGSFPPEMDGIVFEKAGIGRFDEVAFPGLYVVSAKYVAMYRTAWIATMTPKAIVGHSLYVYDVPAQP